MSPVTTFIFIFSLAWSCIAFLLLFSLLGSSQLSLIIGWVCLGVWAINYPRFSAPAFGTGTQGQIRGAIHYLKVCE